MEKRKNPWLAPAAVVAVLAVLAYLAYRRIYAMLFEGAVAASVEDVYTVLRSIALPLVLIAAAIIAAIVIWFVVSGREAEQRRMIRWQSVICAVLVAVLCVNWICLGKQYALLNQVLSGGGISEETTRRAQEIGEQISEEGYVLLKNEQGGLPISADTPLNVFGWGATQPNYGGSGSGSVDESKVVTLLAGIQNAGFTINMDLIDFYTSYRADRPEVGMAAVDWTIVQPTMEDYDAAGIFENAKAFSDSALIVISRSGGEGMDLPNIYSKDCAYDKTQMGGDVVFSTQEDDLDSSKSYLELSNRELALVERVTAEFDNVYVIINATNPMELGWLDDYASIRAAILAPGAGDTGFNALGHILSGEVNPSARLVDTYVYDLRTTPTFNNFGEYKYTNYAEATGGENNVAKFVNYVEGIYVGYKFYETAAAEGLIDYDSVVQYPFGYGLSYTTFEEEISGFQADGTSVTMEISVTNTGDAAGKDVVEIYYTPPYYNGGIEKASVNLLDFAKTNLLQPGESQTLTVTFEYEDMASYDTYGYGCYVLERGDYVITLNRDSQTVVDSRSVTVDADVIYDEAHDGKRPSDLTAAGNAFAGYSEGVVTYLSRQDGFANYEAVTAPPAVFTLTDEQIAAYQSKYTFRAEDYDDPDAVMPVTGAKGSLKLTDMTGLDFDDPLWESLLDQLTVDEMGEMVYNGGFQNCALPSIDAPSTTDQDGPARLSSNYNASKNGAAYPPAVVIAATWNKELARQRGEVLGDEAAVAGITGWYGPGMNTHRTAFAGRNFEYYSEDGVLGAKIAAAEVGGATAKGVMAYIKHFALNDQETSRTNGLCTFATEQSIRETYLKPFEHAVKEGGSLAVMTAFNSIGVRWCGSNPDLLIRVLRNEWGFHGSVITDAMDPLADFYMDANRGIRTGLTKGLSFTSDPSLLDNIDAAGTVVALRNAAHDTVYAVANSNAAENQTGMPDWVRTFIVCDVVVALAVAAGEFFLFRRKLRK